MTAQIKPPSAPGSILGGMLLVAGCCIGAGMLALPVLTGLAGFIPSFVMLLLAWGFMTFTALILVEINSWFKRPVNLLSMTQESLGSFGRWVCWVSYLFLFYALLVAYTSASGSILSEASGQLFTHPIPHWAASLFFSVLLGSIVYLGTRPVDLCNRLLMLGLIVAYLGMIVLGLSKIHPSYLLHSELRYSLFSLPVLVISFGFQNMIPSLTNYMKGDVKRVRHTILGGSLIALTVYLIWSLLVLGVVPPETIRESYAKGQEATTALRQILGSSTVGMFAHFFAFFAIVTSFLAQALTLVHFISDGLKISPGHRENVWICLLSVGPPAFFAIVYPFVFFKALSFAGGICAMILFGILPTLMVWSGRYRKQIESRYQVRGGRVSLAIAFAFSLLVIFVEVGRIFNFSIFKF